MHRGGSVYIITNVHHQVLYTGVTSDLVRGVQEHKEGKYDASFTSRYHINKLVYFKNYLTIDEAIKEEKRIKGGNRANKIKLIDSRSPGWKDLWEDISKW